jgi:uncharacterized protein YqeY
MRSTIDAAMKNAMREKQAVRLSTLRLVSAAIKERDIALRGSGGDASGVDDTEIMALLGKMIKQREDSAQQYENGGRLELAERERDEIAIIREFLPEPMDDGAVSAAVDGAIKDKGATSLKDMGAVMNALKADYVGRMDFGTVGKMVKQKLSGKS